jgi:hypothetical protein
VKAPDIPVGGENVKIFPEELNVVQEGILILIIVTVYDSGSVIVGRVYEALLPARTV